jgi:hypothetical protein
MLRPCPGCQRHIYADASSCTFCGVAVAAPVVREPSARVGRLSRALVFAGAIAAAPACGPAVRYEALPAAAANGAVKGHVVRHDGRPVAAYVTLYGQALRSVTGGSDSMSVSAAGDGSFSFANVPPGHYRISVSGLGDSPELDVRAGSAAVIDLELDKPKPVDTRHMAKPYGAPPARRRVV